MGIGTKMKVGASTAALLLAAAVVTTTREELRDNRYLLSSKWAPGVMPIHNDIRVEVKVDGVTVMVRKRRLSPWSETLTAAAGAVVKMTAVSVHPSTQLLDCIILVNGRTVPGTGFDQRTSVGTVTCQAG